MASTGVEHNMSDTVKFKHHTIAISELTPVDRILEAAQQLDSAIKQQPKQAHMDEITAIELLRTVLLGEKKSELPLQPASRFKRQNNIRCPQRK
jgi:hypothetical protein